MESYWSFLDMRTIFLTMVITNLVCTLVLLLLWRQNYKRLEGISYWVMDYSLQTLTVILIILRGHIPDWISIDLANTLSILGIYLGYRGLEKFFHLKSVQWYNYVLLLIFPIIFTWMTFIHPDLAVRNFIIGLFSFIFCFQCVWLLFFRINRSAMRMALMVGLVFVLYCIIDLFRMFHYIYIDHTLANYMDAGYIEAFIILSYKILLIVLCFGLALLFNRSLLNDIAVEEEKFSKAFHTSPYAIILTRLKDNFILDINETFHSMTGYLPEDMMGHTTSMLHFWQDPSERAFVLEELDLGREVRGKEYAFRKKNGELFTGLYFAQIITINEEKCLMSSIHDISIRKKAEEALVNNEARLKNLNATKDKFFSIIAHDLKSPFNSILGFSQLLGESVRTKEYENVEQYASIIEKSTQRTLELLTNLLEWSRSQTGRMEFTPEYFEIGSLLNEVLELLEQSALQKSITITKDHFSEATVFADRDLLSTVLRNLLSNAIKFTHPGGKVELSTKTREGMLQVCIRDNGVGITKEDLKKLFRIEEGFSRKGTQNEQGTGLGLLLCKEFVEKQGGTIWVESELDHGSMFCFTLPTNS